MGKIPSLGIIATIPLIVVGCVFLYLGFTTSPEVLSDDGFPVQIFYYILGGITIIPSLIALIVNVRRSYFIKRGLRGEAEILSREKTGKFLNEEPQYKFLLLITLPGDEIYEVEHNEYVDFWDEKTFEVGTKIPVIVDPNNPKKILLVLVES